MRSVERSLVYFTGTALASIVATFAGIHPAVAAPTSGDGSSPAQLTVTDSSTAGGDSAAAGATGLGEVLVTARRRVEVLQNVPVAVTSVTGRQLELRSVRTIDDMSRIAPGLTIGQGSRGAAIAVVSMRGQENTGQSLANDPAVGIYFDEVYLGRTAGNILASVEDMSSVQVLRGPQGTLFGRNNTGGAILMTPNRPTLHGFSGQLVVNGGSFGHVEYGGLLDATLVDGAVGLRMQWKGIKQGGVGDRSVITGIDTWGNKDRQLGRFALRLRPISALTLDFTYDYTRIDETGPFQVALTQASAFPSLGFREDRAGLTSPRSYAFIDGFTFHGEYEVSPDMRLKAIVGRRSVRTDLRSDVDGTPANSIDVEQFMDQVQWSGEFQVSGMVLRDASPWLKGLSYTAGAFYFTESGQDGSALPIPFATQLTAGRYIDNIARNASTAGYAQFESNTADRFFVTVGVRYTSDVRDLTAIGIGSGKCTLVTLGAATPIAQCRISGSRTFNYWSYSAGGRFQIDSHTNVYLKYDQGERAGGLKASPTSIDPFQPEIVASLELGLKAEWLQRRLRTNLALYTAHVDNVQRTTLALSPDGTPYTSVFNVATSRVQGFEAEVAVIPVTGLTLEGSLGITDAKYLSFPDPRPGPTFHNDLSYLQYPNTPKVTYALAASYQMPVADVGTLLFRVDYAWRSRMLFDPFNDPRAFQNGYGLLNARIQLDLDNVLSLKGVSVAVYGRNIGGVDYNDSATVASGFVRTDNRRSFGVEVRGKF